MDPVPDFQYTSLEDPENSFRLLQLVPAREGDSTLRAILRTFRRDSAPPYKPVSYTWGIQVASSELLLRTFGEKSGWYRFPIRPNLKALLEQARSSFGTTPLWVDAICINQNDNHEKGHQVRTMDKIYRDQDVMIWLGEPSHNSDLAMDLIDQFADCWNNTISEGLEAICAFINSPSIPTDTWQAVCDLFYRPWFCRRWIVQEFVLSGHKHFWIGHRSQCVRYLQFLASYLSRCRPHLEGGRKTTNACQLHPQHTHDIPAMEMDPIESFLRLWSVYKAAKAGETLELTLERLLDSFSGFLSHDPRDGIYAFLSMASDVDVSKWFPDYSDQNTTINLYGKVVVHIMRITGSTDIICHCAQEFAFASGVSHPSGWIPWFGPQTVYFPGCSDSRDCQAHTHDVHGYNTRSLTTFGQPLQRISLGEPGWIGQTICDGCEAAIGGRTGVKCLDCPDFDYCYACARNSDVTHDIGHQFKLHNGTVYCASQWSAIQVVGHEENWRPCSCPLPNCPTPLRLRGFFADTIKAIEDTKPPKITRERGSFVFSYPWHHWMGLPGMAEHVDEAGLPDDQFVRAITGNRKVAGGSVQHVTDSWIKMARTLLLAKLGLVEELLNTNNPEKTDRMKEMEVAESMEIMLSMGRRFATTAGGSIGFVPKKAMPGDSIAIMVGCSVPVVIRKLDPVQDVEPWRFVGECYIDGLMEGEFMDSLPTTSRPLDITLI